MTSPTGMHISALVLVLLAVAASADADGTTDVQTLIDHGAFAEAEVQLKAQIADPSAPVTSEAARQLEILRRTRYDFPLDADAVLAELRQSVPDVTPEDVRRWTETGDLQHRIVDGEVRYFRRAASNLFRINTEARKRRDEAGNTPNPQRSDTTSMVRKLVRLADQSDEALIHPVHHRVGYKVSVNKDHARVKPGAVVRAWLPFPQEYRQQGEVRLTKSVPRWSHISQNGAPHRTVYFEQTIDEVGTLPSFEIEFEFVTRAYCPRLDPDLVEPYETESELYRRYTAERLPHIAFTPQVQALVKEIVGDETNPLEKALLVFRWVSRNIPWVSEMEYGIIGSLSDKGLSTRCGDCGVQGMVFITLCRAAGVPARWQSGWQTKPGNWNMHDWSEFYVEPWGWLPADASYGLQRDPDPRVRDFFCGHMDPYRLIVNLDYAQPLDPAKISFRSEPNDFQRGEIEIDGHNLYFDEWDYEFAVTTTPLDTGQKPDE